MGAAVVVVGRVRRPVLAGRGRGRRCRRPGRRARRQSGGEAQDDLAGVVDDAGGDAEQHPAHELRLAAARQMPGRLGAEHQVVEQREQVQRERRAVQPDAVGVQVGQRQAAEADAELGVLDALFDLRAVAVMMLDRRGVAVEVGEDEAVAVDDVGFAGEPEVELLARDRALAPGPRVIARARRPGERRGGRSAAAARAPSRSGCRSSRRPRRP